MGAVGNPVVEVTQTYQFNFTNFAESLPWLEGEYVPTKGGVLQGTDLRLYGSNSYYPAELLPIGQSVASLNISDLPDTTNGENELSFTHWATYNWKLASRTSAMVTESKKGMTTEYIMINSKLRCLPNTNIMIKRSGVYFFERAFQVTEGDYLVDEDLVDKPVMTVEVIRETVSIVTLDVEVDDVYWADGFLIHD